MSTIKSFSVGLGDMFYIDHNSDNFTIIDCCFQDDRQEEILDEIALLASKKAITRFISTHPDEDHVRGLQYLDDRLGLLNFYCVQNDAAKEDETDSFIRYRALHDSEKAFYISKGCSRKWMNKGDDPPGPAGISILWPNLANPHFQQALLQSAAGYSPNNISAVVRYSLENGASALWMGDLDSEFMENVKDELVIPPTDILFAPHHGRDSGKVPCSLLDAINPKIVVIGEANSEHLNYYRGFDTITQNSAGDIIFDCRAGKVDVFTGNNYSATFLHYDPADRAGYYYAGTLKLN